MTWYVVRLVEPHTGMHVGVTLPSPLDALLRA